MVKIKIMAVSFFLLVGFAAASPGMQGKKFDLFISTGYGFGVGGYYAGSSSTTSGISTLSREDHYQNFGWGLKFEGGADYLLMEHVYGLAALNYSFSAVPGTENLQTIQNLSTESEKNHWSVFGIKVGVKPTFRIFDLLDAYTTFGIGLYFAGSGADLTATVGNNVSTQKRSDTDSPAMTLIAALGAEYPINESVIAYAEINCEQMSFTKTKSEFTDATGDFFTNRTVNYQEDVTDRQAPPKIPGTNISIRVGVRFPIF